MSIGDLKYSGSFKSVCPLCGSSAVLLEAMGWGDDMGHGVSLDFTCLVCEYTESVTDGE